MTEPEGEGAPPTLESLHALLRKALSLDSKASHELAHWQLVTDALDCWDELEFYRKQNVELAKSLLSAANKESSYLSYGSRADWQYCVSGIYKKASAGLQEYYFHGCTLRRYHILSLLAYKGDNPTLYDVPAAKALFAQYFDWNSSPFLHAVPEKHLKLIKEEEEYITRHQKTTIKQIKALESKNPSEKRQSAAVKLKSMTKTFRESPKLGYIVKFMLQGSDKILHDREVIDRVTTLIAEGTSTQDPVAGPSSVPMETVPVVNDQQIPETMGTRKRPRTTSPAHSTPRKRQKGKKREYEINLPDLPRFISARSYEIMQEDLEQDTIDTSRLEREAGLSTSAVESLGAVWRASDPNRSSKWLQRHDAKDLELLANIFATRPDLKGEEVNELSASLPAWNSTSLQQWFEEERNFQAIANGQVDLPIIVTPEQEEILESKYQADKATTPMTSDERSLFLQTLPDADAWSKDLIKEWFRLRWQKEHDAKQTSRKSRKSKSRSTPAPSTTEIRVLQMSEEQMARNEEAAKVFPTPPPDSSPDMRAEDPVEEAEEGSRETAVNDEEIYHYADQRRPLPNAKSRSREDGSIPSDLPSPALADEVYNQDTMEGNPKLEQDTILQQQEDPNEDAEEAIREPDSDDEGEDDNEPSEPEGLPSGTEGSQMNRFHNHAGSADDDGMLFTTTKEAKQEDRTASEQLAIESRRSVPPMVEQYQRHDVSLSQVEEDQLSENHLNQSSVLRLQIFQRAALPLTTRLAKLAAKYGFFVSHLHAQELGIDYIKADDRTYQPEAIEEPSISALFEPTPSSSLPNPAQQHLPLPTNTSHSSRTTTEHESSNSQLSQVYSQPFATQLSYHQLTRLDQQVEEHSQQRALGMW